MRRNHSSQDPAAGGSRRPLLNALLVGVLALVARMIYVVVAGGDVGIDPGTDAVSYDQFARLMLEGWHWVITPLAEREPLYPALMAFGYILPGNDILGLQIMQALVGSLAVAAVYLGLRGLVRPVVSLGSAFFIALSPHFVPATAMPFRENLIVPLVAVFSVVVLHAFCRDSGRARIGTAVTLAMLIHTDVRYLLLIVTLPVMGFVLTRAPRLSIRGGLVMGGLTLLLMIPYQIRGYVALGETVVVTTRFLRNTGDVTTATAVSGAPADWAVRWETRTREKQETASPTERDYFDSGARPSLSTTAIYWYRFKEYWRFARFTPEYAPYPEGEFCRPWSRSHTLASSMVILPFLLALPLVWVGAPVGERWIALALLGYVAAHCLLHMLSYSTERYRIAVEPILEILKAMGVVNLLALLVSHTTWKDREFWRRSLAPPAS